MKITINKNINKLYSGALWMILIIYLVVLFKVILIKYYPLNYIFNEMITNIGFNNLKTSLSCGNFIPFKTVVDYLVNKENLSILIIKDNILGNVIAFIPFGFLMCLIFNNSIRLKNVFKATFSLSLLLEGLQLITGLGIFDIDDLILNTFGGVIGLLIYRLIKNIIDRFTSTEILNS